MIAIVDIHNTHGQKSMPDDFPLDDPQEEEVDVQLEQDAEESLDGPQGAGAADSPPADQQDGDGGTDAAQATHSDRTWQQSLEEAGFQTFDDVDKAVRALVESNRQRDEQLSTYAEQLRFYQDQVRYREQLQAGQPSQQQPSQQPAAEEAAADPIQELLSDWADPSWAAQFIETDEDGNRVIADHVDDETRKRIVSMDRKIRQWQDIISNPSKFAEAVDARVQRMIEDRFEHSYVQKQTQQQETQAEQDFVNSNATWLFQQDPATGQYVRDPVTGQLIYSDLGYQFDQTMKELAQEGIGSKLKQIEFAKRAMAGLIPVVPSSSVAPIQQRSVTNADLAAQKRNEMRGRANDRRSPQREFNGVTSESGSGPTGSNTMSWGELTFAAMTEGQ